MILRNNIVNRTEIFVNNQDDYDFLCCQYDLTDCGNSGKYDGYSWSCDDTHNVDVYYKNCTDDCLQPTT